MNTSFHQGSAKIYQFPVRVRPTIAAQDQARSADINASRISEAACGSGWYHEAAIAAESKQQGER